MIEQPNPEARAFMTWLREMDDDELQEYLEYCEAWGDGITPEVVDHRAGRGFADHAAIVVKVIPALQNLRFIHRFLAESAAEAFPDADPDAFAEAFVEVARLRRRLSGDHGDPTEILAAALEVGQRRAKQHPNEGNDQ
jgi:hypothetical protein